MTARPSILAGGRAAATQGALLQPLGYFHEVMDAVLDQSPVCGATRVAIAQQLLNARRCMERRALAVLGDHGVRACPQFPIGKR